METVINCMEKLHAKGYSSFTCNLYLDSRGKKSMASAPQFSIMNHADCPAVWNASHTAAVLLTGQKSGMIMIDIDDAVLWAADSAGMPAIDCPAETTLRSDDCYHFYFKYDSRFPSNKVGIRGYIDVRSNGGLSFCSPSKLGDRQYKWLPGRSLLEKDLTPIPDWLADLLLDSGSPNVADRPAAAPVPSADVDLELVDRLLSIASPDKSRLCWLQTGIFLKRSGFPAQKWIDWSRSSVNFDERECKYNWTNLSKYNYSMGTLKFWARECDTEGLFTDALMESYERAYHAGTLIDLMNLELRYISRSGKASYLLLDEGGDYTPKGKVDLEEHYYNRKFWITESVTKRLGNRTITEEKEK